MRTSKSFRLLACWVLAVAIVGAAVGGRITRASMQVLERGSDSSLEGMLTDDPLRILGSTRAVYLDGYGVVFSAEIELAPGSTPNPFRMQFTKEDLARIKEKKKVRLSQLREHMRTLLVTYATLDVPLHENVALAVTIPYFRQEDSAGLPRQIVMSAPRKLLLDARAGKPEGLASALKVQEYQ